MLPSSKIVKATAKTAFKGKVFDICKAGAPLIFACAFFGVLSDLLAQFVNAFILSVASGLFILFVICPLVLGEFFWFRRFIWGENDPATEVFRYFGGKARYLRAVVFSLAFLLRTVIILAIFSIPAAVASMLSENSFYIEFNSTMPSWAPNLVGVSNFLLFGAFIALIVMMAKYYPAPFLFVSLDEDKSVGEIMRLSAKISRNTRGEYLLFLVSFWPWLLASLFIFPLFFTVPYFIICLCIFSRFTVAHYNKAIGELQQTTPRFEAHF